MKRLDQGFAALHLDLHPATVVAHPAGQPEAAGKPDDEGPEAHPDHPAHAPAGDAGRSTTIGIGLLPFHAGGGGLSWGAQATRQPLSAGDARAGGGPGSQSSQTSKPGAGGGRQWDHPEARIDPQGKVDDLSACRS